MNIITNKNREIAVLTILTIFVALSLYIIINGTLTPNQTVTGLQVTIFGGSGGNTCPKCELYRKKASDLGIKDVQLSQEIDDYSRKQIGRNGNLDEKDITYIKTERTRQLTIKSEIEAANYAYRTCICPSYASGGTHGNQMLP